jgi:hypothetical protein
VSLLFFNCASVPLCIVGVSLAVVALVAHKDRNHLFTWMGLLGNGIVIVVILGLYLWGTLLHERGERGLSVTTSPSASALASRSRRWRIVPCP